MPVLSGAPLIMFGVRGRAGEKTHAHTHARHHLLNTGDGPDFVVGILPAVLQSRNEGELLLLEELILLLDAAEGLFDLIHCCS